MQGRTIIRTLTISTILLAGLFAGIASAGQIDPSLEARMNASAADELIQVVIRPVGTLVGSALKKQVTSQYATRAEQHTAAVQALQATANITQPAILTAMALPYFDGRVYNVKGFWIDNVITAEMTSSAIAELSRRPDIDEILAMPKIELVAPIPADATDVTDEQTVQNGLKAIRADSVWAMGYTGSGRLVASLDTGVDGKHILLSPKWRGHNGYSLRESWFDPVYNDTVPRNYSGSGAQHGTQVMGIMVAVVATDTFGVCPDCQWISAAAIDIPCPTNLDAPCANLFEALQWVADPDGDPLTDHDVPDAVANPWGAVTYGYDEVLDRCVVSGIGCSDIFWNAIDNIEAAGAVMIFAAGNEGQCGAGTIRNPANRISSETNAFSVGMVDTRTDIVNPPVHPLSSFGPSDCNGTTVKPELVAPGVNLRSTVPPNGVSSTALGTSFSTPHVAAAVALLREYNPNASVDQIKQALLDGARDLGPAGPDNQYGHGILNVVAALRALPANTQPSISVRKNYYIRPSPGQSAQVVLVLKNSGTVATGVNVSITSSDARLTIQDGTAPFANMPNVGDTAANHDDPFDVTASLADLQSGERLPITVTITAAGGYTKTMQAAIQTGPVKNTDIYTHDAGNFEMTISPFGGFGLQIDNLNPRKGQNGYGKGYLYGGDNTPSLFEGGFIVGVGPEQVSDAVRNSSGSPDVDFLVDPGGRLTVVEPGPTYPEETRAGMSDANAENPIGVFIEQRTWVSDDPDEDDYLICEYTIWNRSGQTISGLRAGLYFDWDFPWVTIVGVDTTATNDGGGFDAELGVGWLHDRFDPLRLRGVLVVSPLGATSYHYFDNFDEVYDGLTESEKWNAMTEGFVQTGPPLVGDGSHLIATGPYIVQADSAVRVAFAIIGATNEQALLNSAQEAKNNYNAGTVTVSPAFMQFDAPVGGPDPSPQDITIRNGTDVAITFGVSEIPVFATLDPGIGEIAAGESGGLTVRATVGDRTSGTYRDTLVLTTSDPLLPTVRIQVTLTVGGGGNANVNPNPFNPTSAGTVALSLIRAATAGTHARVYDLGGFLVRDIGTVSTGATSLAWDGRTGSDVIVANGVYICYVEAPGSGGYKQTFKIAVKKN